MGWLDGGAARLFGELLSPLYLPAVLRRQGNTYDEGGKLRRGGEPADCLVQVDRCTERMVATEGYTDTDQAIYILASSLEGGVDTDCEVTPAKGPYAGVTFKLAAPIDRDPATAYHLARGVLKKQKAAADGG